MTAVINFWPDPDLRTTNRTGFVAANLFPNPTPTVDLTHWSAVPGGSITRTADAALFPETSYGCRVVDGVSLAGATTADNGLDNTFTGRVRASEAMTITISLAMLDPTQTPETRTVGWGDFGWGETLVYEDGASKTFAADETATFRIYGGEANPGVPSVDHNIVVTLSGTGTFDVDGIVQWIGVDDGAGDLFDAIPDAPLFFDGDTPDDANFTYSWFGTAHDSASLQTASIPKHAWCTYAYEYSAELDPGPHAEGAFAVTKGGEHRVALRSEIMFGRPDLIFSDGTVPENPEYDAGFPLPPGNYVFSFDYVTDYPVYFYGYPEPEWACNAYFYIEDADPAGVGYPWNRLAYAPINGYPPYRQRMALPFTATETSIIQPYLTTGQDWVTGDVYITNVAVFEIPEILHRFWDLPSDTGGLWDLTAMGVEAGKSYHSNMEMSDANGHPVFEYKVGEGDWITLVESTLAPTVEPIMLLGEYFDFTVPADATEVRLRMTDPAINVATFDLFSSPPEFFSGDTADGWGYSYSWSGTPYDSTSVRTDAPAPGPTAQVWVGGTAQNVGEMRVVVAGTLVPVIAIRNGGDPL
jgi:hypothetical protein